MSKAQRAVLLDAVSLRDRLTNKALAARFGLTQSQLETQIRLARRRARKLVPAKS